MLITKLGHCCLLVRRDPDTGFILTDPGNYSKGQSVAKNVDAIVITHEHEDHCHLKSIKEILKYNPDAKIITNASVGKLLEKDNIPHVILNDGENTMVNDVYLQAFDSKHAEIYEELGQVQNTAFMIGELLLPGDSYFVPPDGAKILALPVAGPWCKISDAIRYALKVKPKMVFPIHDGMLDRTRRGGSFRIPQQVLEANGIQFDTMTRSEDFRVEYMFLDKIEPYRRGYKKGPW